MNQGNINQKTKVMDKCYCSIAERDTEEIVKGKCADCGKSITLTKC